MTRRQTCCWTCSIWWPLVPTTWRGTWSTGSLCTDHQARIYSAESGHTQLYSSLTVFNKCWDCFEPYSVKNMSTVKSITWSYQSQTPSPHCSLKQDSSWQPAEHRGINILTEQRYKSVSYKVLVCWFTRSLWRKLELSRYAIPSLTSRHILNIISWDKQPFMARRYSDRQPFSMNSNNRHMGERWVHTP